MEFGSDVVLTVPVDPDIDYEEIDEMPAYPGGAAFLSSAQYAAGPNDPDACILEILDTATAEDWGMVWSDRYARDHDAWIIVYAVNQVNAWVDAQTFYNWLYTARKAEPGTLPIVMVANKCDLLDADSFTEVQDWGRAHDVPVVRASAKTGLGVDASFMTLVKLLPPSARHKIAVLGCSGSGKSALTMQFTLNVFLHEYDPTIGDHFLKVIRVPGISNKAVTAPAQPGLEPSRRSSRTILGTLSSLLRRRGIASTRPPPPPSSSPDQRAPAAKKIRRVAKADTNVVALNLASLAQLTNAEELSSPPRSCGTCNAFLVRRTSGKCPFCNSGRPARHNEMTGTLMPVVESYDYALPNSPASESSESQNLESAAATDISLTLHAPRGWYFEPSAYPGTSLSAFGSILTLSCAHADAISFAFTPSSSASKRTGPAVHFQARITYRPPASGGDVRERVIHATIPTTSSRARAESGANVRLLGTHLIRDISLRVNEYLSGSGYGRINTTQARDTFLAVNRLLSRAARERQEEEMEMVSRIARESGKLDWALESVFRVGPGFHESKAREDAVAAFGRGASIVFSTTD